MADQVERTLLLLRHAEAEAFSPGRRDIDRSLTETGRDQARAAGAELRRRNLQVDLVLCSSSRRTRQTLDELGLTSGPDAAPEVTYLDAVYDAGSDTLRDLLTALPTDVGCVLLIGHAPGLPRLAHELADPDTDPELRAELDRGYPTATLAGFRLSRAWSRLADGEPVRLDWLRSGHAASF